MALLALLLARLFKIQLCEHARYKKLRDAHSISFQYTSPLRGSIFSSDNRTLAVSIPCTSVYAVPELIHDKAHLASILSKRLGLRYNDLLKRLSKRRGSQPAKFSWIKRKVSHHELSLLKDLDVEGIRLIKEFRRYYPHGKIAAHILGFTGIDEQGLEGIEARMEEFLRIPRIDAPVRVDGRRRIISASLFERSFEEVGTDLYLTIDLRIQYILEQELESAYRRWKATSAVGIVIDPQTGQILGLANRPTFDPNFYQHAPAPWRRNLALTDPYEPGSAMKPFIAAAALQEGIFHPEQPIFCENGSFRIGPRTIRDYRPFSRLAFSQVISKSSNIGAVKIGLRLGAKRVHRYLYSFGFGRKTGIGLPESPGRLTSSPWDMYTLTSVPMGYELLVTPLQLLVGFCSLINGGKLIRPYIISKVIDHQGKVRFRGSPRVIRYPIDTLTSRIIKRILLEVVQSGTARRAKIPGIRFGGKTGTTKKYDPIVRRYVNRYTSTFIGFAPYEDPRVCVIVVVDEPMGSYYAGIVSAPVVANIIRRSLKFIVRKEEGDEVRKKALKISLTTSKQTTV